MGNSTFLKSFDFIAGIDREFNSDQYKIGIYYGSEKIKKINWPSYREGAEISATGNFNPWAAILGGILYRGLWLNVVFCGYLEK